MIDNVDVTQWLPRDTPIINRFRAAKGDIDGHVVDGRMVSIQVVDVTIASELLYKRIIENHHYECGISLIELLNAQRAMSGYKKSSIYLEQFGGLVTTKEAHDILCAIRQHMGSDTIKVIEYTYDKKAAPDTLIKNSEGQEFYRECFDLLMEASDIGMSVINSEKRA